MVKEPKPIIKFRSRLLHSPKGAFVSSKKFGSSTRLYFQVSNPEKIQEIRSRIKEMSALPDAEINLVLSGKAPASSSPRVLRAYSMLSTDEKKRLGIKLVRPRMK